MTFYRRAVGFDIRVDTRRRDEVLVGAEGHGAAPLARTRLREWMALDHFVENPLPAHVLSQLDARDLIYHSEDPAPHLTTGAPLKERTGNVALRGNVKVVPLIGEDLQPLPFMPRRGSLPTALTGLRFYSLEMETHAYSVTISGEIAALRALLPQLTGMSTWEALAEAHALLEWLDDCALLTSTPPPRHNEGDLTWLGHAAVLAHLGDASVLVDPMFAPTPEPRRGVAMPDWRTLPPLDAIAITHADHDHLHPSSLLLLPPQTPVFFPAAALQPYQVDAEALLALLGFTDVTRVQPWQTITLRDTQLTATPFTGENWGLALAQTTYVVAGPRGAIYLAADSRLDATALERIAAEHVIDFAFLGVTGSAEPLAASARYGYGHFYKAFLDRAQRNAWTIHTAGPEESARAAALLKAKRVFGYAAGGGTFTKLAFSDRGTHAQLATRLAGIAVDLPLGVSVRLNGL